AQATLLTYAVVPVAAWLSLRHPAWLTGVAVVAGGVAGIASPGARVDLYDVIPRERLHALYLPLYVLSLLQTAGYAVGAVLFRFGPALPFYTASVLVLASFATYMRSPARRIVCEGEENLTLGKTLFLLRTYTSPELMTLAALATLLAMGNALFYISGVFRLLTSSESGVTVGLAVAGILVLTIAAQLLVRRVRGFPIAYGVAPLPVLALIAMFGFERPGVLVATWVAFALFTFNARIGVFSKLYSFVRVDSALQMAMTQLLSTAGIVASAILLQAMHSRHGLAFSFGAYAVLWLVFALAVWLNGMKGLLTEGPAPPAIPAAQASEAVQN
ncbi:MAG: hypothetical protein RBU21_10315, partial [FCB group bacterium]|nr:hypothetical protein [FCB group bacterium]